MFIYYASISGSSTTIIASGNSTSASSSAYPTPQSDIPSPDQEGFPFFLPFFSFPPIGVFYISYYTKYIPYINIYKIMFN